MGVYRPLLVMALLEGCPLQGSNSVATMRMNLLASSRDDPRVLFVVNDDKILVYRFSTLTPSALPTLVDRISDPRSVDEDSMDRTINVMQVGYLGTEEVLVTANEAGEVCVWFTSNFRRDPLLLSVTESAWGVAIHAERRLIGISTNAHTVTVFHCGTNSRTSPRHYSDESSPSAHADIWSATNEPSTSQQTLSGHGHNIPCVTFSPCGRFVATASVDRTCRTWRLSDGQQIQQKPLDPLWGWGVRFVPEDSWTTITRAEYRRIPKDHLRPGKHPGLNVRDSPFSATASTQRRLPPGRDLRMIRTKWYAGPIQEDRARQHGSHHSEGGNTRRQPGGAEQDAQENEEMDDRDAALFGMDDDEDEWEDTSSSDPDELDGQGEHSDDQHEQPPVRNRTNSQVIGSGSSTNPSPTSNLRASIPRLSSMEVSVDTGDDGDNEGTGIDTEDAAGTAGESSSSASRTTGRDRKLERRSLLSMKALETQQHSRDHGESSSEQEQTKSEAPEACPETTPLEPSHTELEPPAEFQPVITSTFQNGGPFANLIRVTPFQKVQTSGTPISPATLAPPPPSPTGPEFPTELLLCATARNIYLLGPHPLAEAGGSVSQEGQPHVSAVMMPYATEVTSITLIDDEDDDSEMAVTGDFAANEEDEEDENTDDDSSTDHHHHHHHSHHVHGDSDSSNDDTGDSDELESDDDGPGLGSDPEHGTSISMLHTLTVARSAATRADGRRYHHLEHFDRLFVMELVPELSILVAASQKGTITIFRLLRVLDDPVASLPPATAAGTGTEAGKDAASTAPVAAEPGNSEDTTFHRDKRHKGKGIGSHGDDKQTIRHHPTSKAKNKKDDKIDTITVKGVNYVLFPEMYLPRLEPSPLPLYGVSVVPLQHTAPGSTSRSRKGSSSNSFQSARSDPSSPSRSPTLFILHLMYMDSQLFSYELRLRNDKDDPVRLGNIFV